MAKLKTSGEFFIYVRKYSIFTNKEEPYVYRVKTKDIFHSIGEMEYRTMEHISWISFVEVTEEREKYWAEKGVEIRTWRDKYWEDEE